MAGNLAPVLISFRRWDSNVSGLMPLETFAAVLQKLAACQNMAAPNHEELAELVGVSRTRQGGEVAYVRFLRWLWTQPWNKGFCLRQTAALLPHELTAEGLECRRKLWKNWDVNRNKKLSLAEFERGVLQDLLSTNEGSDDAKILLRVAKPALAKAHAAARAVFAKGNPDQVEFCEFRPLLAALARYLELLEVFDAIDSSGDRVVDLEEFSSALCLLRSWGGAAFEAAAKAEHATFEFVAGQGANSILFDDFSSWAIREHIGEFKADEELTIAPHA